MIGLLLIVFAGKLEKNVLSKFFILVLNWEMRILEILSQLIILKLFNMSQFAFLHNRPGKTLTTTMWEQFSDFRSDLIPGSFSSLLIGLKLCYKYSLKLLLQLLFRHVLEIKRKIPKNPIEERKILRHLIIGLIVRTDLDILADPQHVRHIF